MTESQTEITANLRRVGLRATAPRIAILAAIRQHGAHPSAEDIVECLDGPRRLSQSTVYNTLQSFLDVGLVRRVTGDGSRLRVDGTLDAHDHAVCRECGGIFDVAPETWRSVELPKEISTGLRVLGVRVEFEVVCASCVEEPRVEQPCVEESCAQDP